MAFLAITSAKGSPGATTTALVLAAAWRRRPALLAELDPSGSDLVYRLRDTHQNVLTPDAGLLGYVSTGDADVGSDPLAYAVDVASGLSLLTGAPPARAHELAGRWGRLAQRLAAAEKYDVIADCGRLAVGSQAEGTLDAADGVVLVTRPVVDGVAHLLARAAELRKVLAPGVPVHVVVVTDVRDVRSQREIDDLARSAGVPLRILGRLALDPDAVGLLGGTWSPRLDRSLLMRSARELVDRLDRVLTERATRAGVFS